MTEVGRFRLDWKDEDFITFPCPPRCSIAYLGWIKPTLSVYFPKVFGSCLQPVGSRSGEAEIGNDLRRSVYGDT